MKDTAIHRIIYLGNVVVPNANFYGIESENVKNNGDSTLLSFYILFKKSSAMLDLDVHSFPFFSIWEQQQTIDITCINLFQVDSDKS